MKITEILTPDLVLPDLQGTTKADILRELAGCLAAKFTDIDVNALAAVLAERERLGSTAIGDGIAIPHGKIRGATKIVGAFGRKVEGVDFDSLDGGLTHLFFVAGRARRFDQPAFEGVGSRLATAQGHGLSRTAAGGSGRRRDLSPDRGGGRPLLTARRAARA